MQQCKHHFKALFHIGDSLNQVADPPVINYIRPTVVFQEPGRRLYVQSPEIDGTMIEKCVIFGEWLVYAWHMASPSWLIFSVWHVNSLEGGLLCSTNTAHRCHSLFGSYLLHFVHFLPFTLYSQQFPTRISWSKVYGSHFPPDTGGDCAFFRDGTAGIRYPISIYFHLFPTMVEFVGTALYKVGWTLLKNSRILHITCAARSNRITAFILSQAETEWWLGSWKLIQFLGSASFKGQYQWGETSAQESRWCRKNWGSCNWNFPVSDFSSLPSSEVPSVNLNSSLVICPLPEALTGGKYQLLPQLQPNFRTLEECSIMNIMSTTGSGCPSTILKQCLFRWNHVPEADDSLQGGKVMPNDQHMQHRHHLANLCSRNSFPKQDTCDS